ncbi:GNAT family N-acetyltransferase [Dyella subtropica]|uniref:GNAT family N-acetyltransferase n=1 Tax=Dyella subtropica TaxID=2992127 RepID=UPI002256E812|nr:GNAT family protein [Dyella subtropica]
MSGEETLWSSFRLPCSALVLRPWQAGDASALFEAASESVQSVGRWLPWCHAGYARADSEAWIAHSHAGWQRGELFAFAIVDTETQTVVGGLGLNQFNRQHRSANLGYWIRHSRQGGGIASEAVSVIARFGFDTLGLVRVEIVVAEDNLASRRCAEKAGAHFEGIARQRLMIADVPVDAAIYALIPADLAQS